MRKGERRLFFVVLAILLAALALLVAQWVRGGNMPKVYHVSVLLDGAESDYWKNFRAGLNQAALEYNVDLRMVSRYDGENTQSQVLRREWEGQADGVVIIPNDGEALAHTLADAPAKLAVAVMGPRLDTDRVDSYVSPEYDQMGRKLAQEAASDGGRCTLFISPDAGAAALQIAAGLEQGLLERGVTCVRSTIHPAAISAIPKKGALLAVEPDMTETLCQLAGAGRRVYGIGSSSRLLHYLEDGTLSALVVQSDYDAGYLTLSHLVEQLSQGKTGDAVLESYTATGENMLQEPMISILFSTY